LTGERNPVILAGLRRWENQSFGRNHY
jgi:hypothetical protein